MSSNNISLSVTLNWILNIKNSVLQISLLMITGVFLMGCQTISQYFPTPALPPTPTILPQGCPPECENIDLSGKDLSMTKLAGSNFNGANLDRTNLSRVNLGGANLESVHLLNADLRFSNLAGAWLRYSDLRGADLTGADLRGADLLKTNLGGANFSRADISGANLLMSNLSGIKLRGAKYDNTTKWPPDFDPVAAGAVIKE